MGGQGWRKLIILESEKAEGERKGAEDKVRTARNAKVKDGKGRIEWGWKI